MSDNCTDCRDGILNAQKSKIGVPQCQDECSSETNCEGKQTYSDCIGVNPALTCIDTPANEDLSTVLVALDAKICQTLDADVKVAVSESDNCPGFLVDKLVAGDGITLTKEGSGCETFVVAEKCWNWIPVEIGTGDGKFKGNWNSYIFQAVEFSDVKECSVRLRGTAYGTYNSGNKILFTLPVGKRPSATRRYSVNISNALYDIPTGTGFIYINTNGDVRLEYQQTVSGFTVISLDGIQIELN